jgi:predicted secreted protein
MALRAADAVISVATTSGGSYSILDGISGFGMSRKGNSIDITLIGADYIERMAGLKDASYSLSGFYLPADTGQGMIETSWMDRSDLFVKVLPDGTNGFIQQVVVDSFDTDGEADGPVELSCELSGAAAMTATP